MIGTVNQLIPQMLNLDKEKQYELKEFKQKRSLDANAYAWKLISEIAEVLPSSKEEVYLKVLKDYGQSTVICLEKEIDPSGYFKYYEYETTRKLGEKYFNTYKIYKGSSEYNTTEMSSLIKGIVYEAKQLGILTLEDLKINSLVESWGNYV